MARFQALKNQKQGVTMRVGLCYKICQPVSSNKFLIEKCLFVMLIFKIKNNNVYYQLTKVQC